MYGFYYSCNERVKMITDYAAAGGSCRKVHRSAKRHPAGVLKKRQARVGRAIARAGTSVGAETPGTTIPMAASGLIAGT